MSRGEPIKLTSLRGCWDSYLERVVPRGSSDGQVKFTKHAFYAGAMLLHRLMFEAASQPPDAADKSFKAIDEEMEVYIESFESSDSPFRVAWVDRCERCGHQRNAARRNR